MTQQKTIQRPLPRWFCLLTFSSSLFVSLAAMYLYLNLHCSLHTNALICMVQKDIPAKVGDDSLKIALELGRLDLVTILLGFLGIILAICALGGFWMVKHDLQNQAKEAAEDVAKRIATEVATKETANVVANASTKAQDVAQNYLNEHLEALVNKRLGNTAPRIVKKMLKDDGDYAIKIAAAVQNVWSEKPEILQSLIELLKNQGQNGDTDWTSEDSWLKNVDNAITGANLDDFVQGVVIEEPDHDE